jgi:hypothetical protein
MTENPMLASVMQNMLFDNENKICMNIFMIGLQQEPWIDSY